MNPLTNIKNQQKLAQKELDLGLAGSKVSWHSQYKESAWIFTGGLPYDLTEGDIIAVFSQYGEVVNLNLVRDKDTGKSKGYCFLCYEDQRSTILAVDNFNGIKLLGRTIRVDHVADYKKPKEKGDVDDITKQLQEEGCAPKVAVVASVSGDDSTEAVDVKIKKEKKKKHKKEKKKKKSKQKASESSDSNDDDDEHSVKKEKISPNDKRRMKHQPKAVEGKQHTMDTSREIKHERDDCRQRTHHESQDQRSRDTHNNKPSRDSNQERSYDRDMSFNSSRNCGGDESRYRESLTDSRERHKSHAHSRKDRDSCRDTQR